MNELDRYDRPDADLGSGFILAAAVVVIGFVAAVADGFIERAPVVMPRDVAVLESVAGAAEPLPAGYMLEAQ